MASRDASCAGSLVCARSGFDGRNLGECGPHHCSSKDKGKGLSQGSRSCWGAGNNMASRDASCSGSLVCARTGFDGRNFGECGPHHCCSKNKGTSKGLNRGNRGCWNAGNNKQSRDASCEGSLVCARSGFDGRNFGECGPHHCWNAGNNKQSRDASCE